MPVSTPSGAWAPVSVFQLVSVALAEVGSVQTPLNWRAGASTPLLPGSAAGGLLLELPPPPQAASPTAVRPMARVCRMSGMRRMDMNMDQVLMLGRQDDKAMSVFVF